MRTMRATVKAVLRVVFSRETRPVKTNQEIITAAIMVMSSSVMVGVLPCSVKGFLGFGLS